MTESFRISYIHNLGAAIEVAAESGKERIRHTLEIAVKEVIATHQSEMRVVIDSTAGFVVSQRYRAGLRREQAGAGISGGTNCIKLVEGP